MSHCFRNSSLTVIWNKLGLSNCKTYEKELWIKKKTPKTPVIISKRNYLVAYSKVSHLTIMHLWHLNHPTVLGRIFCWTFIERCFLKYIHFLNSIFLFIHLVRQTQIISNDSQWRILLFQMIVIDNSLMFDLFVDQTFTWDKTAAFHFCPRHVPVQVNNACLYPNLALT